MSEKELEYADLVDLPLASCSLKVVPSKKLKSLEQKQEKLIRLKQKALDGLEKRKLAIIGDETNNEKIQALSEDGTEEIDNIENENIIHQKSRTIRKVMEYGTAKKSSRAFNIIYTQFLIICILFSGVFLINIFWQNGPISDILSGAFNYSFTKEAAPEIKNYTDFSLSTPVFNDELTMENGSIIVGGKGGIFAPLQGVVTKILDIDGKKTIEITHNEKFKTIIEGADLAFCEVGETILKSLPFCYSYENSSTTMSFYNELSQIVNFTIGENSILWQE